MTETAGRTTAKRKRAKSKAGTKRTQKKGPSSAPTKVRRTRPHDIAVREGAFITYVRLGGGIRGRQGVLKETAESIGVPYATVAAWTQSDDWVARAKRIRDRRNEILSERLAYDLADYNRDMVKHCGSIRALIVEEIGRLSFGNGLSAVAALEKLDALERKARGEREEPKDLTANAVLRELFEAVVKRDRAIASSDAEPEQIKRVELTEVEQKRLDEWEAEGAERDVSNEEIEAFINEVVVDDGNDD